MRIGDGASMIPGTSASSGRLVVVGALAGAVGTLCMSTLMLPAQWLGWLGTEPPRRIADRLLAEAAPARPIAERDRRVGTTLVHLGIGAAGGAAMALVRAPLGMRLTAPLGALLGAGFWAVNYILAAPALHLFPRPDKDRPGRPPVMLAANILFGLVTAVGIEQGLRALRTRD